ncbi:snRNA-activating protein complex subunit 2 [Salminus brasiliensis]|uniref:snRNA-activating protein complex subunit 2 n=1 Tax=Salminus brasiliensis TaxID=930266 RepID=UPI003B835AF4
MKPPSRQRIRPSRFLGIKRTEPTRGLCTGWSKKEQQNLLRGLSEQLRLKPELDLLELQKKVPKRTVPEIQNIIKFLKGSVVRRVYLQVQKQKREEQRTKTPIEIWAELAQKMAGVHEETISSAFSQMLVIAATEPLSQLHSVPPRLIDLPNPVAHSLPTTLRVNGTSSPAAKTLELETSSLVQPSSISSTEENSNGTQPSSVSGQASAKLSIPTNPKSNLCQTSVSPSKTISKVIPPVSNPSAATMPCPSNSTNQPSKQHACGQSKQDHQHGLVEKALTVDFDKIYNFMSNMNTNKGRSSLTAMESAVLLDLLMSLPEELPLLDCKELQHHLLQVYTRLTSETAVQRPAAAKPVEVDQGTNISAEMQSSQTPSEKNVQKGGDSSAVSKQRNATEVADDIPGQSSAINPPKDRENWATAGLFPLNPFMLPVGLLKRQQP